MALSIIAIVLSVAALAVTVWDKFLRKPDLGAQVDWIVDGAGQRVLRLVFFNMGTRKDCIKEIRFFVHGSDVPWTPAMLDRLPLVLDVDEASNPPFLLHRLNGTPQQDNPFQAALRIGKGLERIEVENIHGKITGFPAPVIE